MGVYFGETEITSIDNLVPQAGQDITQAFFGSTEVFTVWDEYDGVLPAQYSANGDYLADYRIYGASGGVGDRTPNIFDSTKYQTITANQKYNCTVMADDAGITLSVAGADPYVGQVLPSGVDVSSLSNIFMPCKAETTYTISASKLPKCYVTYINESGISVGFNTITANVTNFTFTTKPDTKYLLFRIGDGNAAAGDTIRIDAIAVAEGATPIPYGYEVDMSVGGWSPMQVQAGTYISVNTGGTISAGTYSTAFFTAPAEGSAEISIVDNYGSGRLLVYMPYDVGGTALTTYGKQEVYSGSGAHTMTVTVPSGAATIGVSYLNSDTDKGIKTTTPIYIGSSPLNAYEYIDYASGKITRRTDNLVPPSPAFETTDGGITISTDGDGVYRISGTADSAVQKVQITLPIPQFSEPLSVAEGGNGAVNFFNSPMNGVAVEMKYDNNTARQIELSSSYESAAYTYVGNIVQKVYVNITGGQTVNGTFSLMITDTGSIPQTYEPYVAPVDPPIPLPALPTVDGTNIVDYAGQSAAVPSRFVAKYRKQNF